MASVKNTMRTVVIRAGVRDWFSGVYCHANREGVMCGMPLANMKMTIYSNTVMVIIPAPQTRINLAQSNGFFFISQPSC
jgi:hypothetical protein